MKIDADKNHLLNDQNYNDANESIKQGFEKENEELSRDEKKLAIRQFFIEEKEDKITGHKSIMLKKSLKEWQYSNLGGEKTPDAKPLKELRVKDPIMLAKAVLYIGLIHVNVRGITDLTNIFLGYFSKDFYHPGFSNAILFFLADEEARISFQTLVKHDADRRLEKGNFHNLAYIANEECKLEVNENDFLIICKSKKLEYKFVFENITLEGEFDIDELMRLKAFYWSVFDDEFEVDLLYDYVAKKTEKNKPSNNMELSGTPGGKNEGCYIATQVYGSYDHPNVIQLRRFRDDVLKGSKFGRFLIAKYYKYSPTVARKMNGKPLVNNLTKRLLDLFLRIYRS